MYTPHRDETCYQNRAVQSSDCYSTKKTYDGQQKIQFNILNRKFYNLRCKTLCTMFYENTSLNHGITYIYNI